MDEEEIDGVKSPIKRLGSTRKLLVFNITFELTQIFYTISNWQRKERRLAGWLAGYPSNSNAAAVTAVTAVAAAAATAAAGRIALPT
uniref:Uncharacterized protein n=1 Tax=Vespula pensylvanica TaxID=30213 RepID=A0A834N0G7_VESPE|nr:hypothetical protein H0235_017616 [Vespula pensylvanica]